MRIPTPLLILIVTFMTIGSQLILKRAVNGITLVLKHSGVAQFLIAAAASPWVWMALSLQAMGYVVWLFVLTGERLSVAFAISGSFFYIVMAAASWFFFSERLTPLQWLGLFLISGGVLLVTLASKA